jgi:hypothetical protein
VPHLLARQPRAGGDGSGTREREVPRELLAGANGLQQTLRTLLRLLAPTLGAGVLVSLGGPAVAALDAATFLIAAALIATLPVQSTAEKQTPATTDGTSIAAGKPEQQLDETGFHYLRKHPVLRPMTLACALSLLVISFSNALSFTVATTVLHHTASFVAVLTTMQGIGALVGGPSAGPLLKRLSHNGAHGDAALMVLALTGAVLATILRAIPELYCVLAGNLVMGIAVPWLLVSAITSAQGRSPAAIRGRVIAAASLAGNLPQLFGQAIGAALVAVLPYFALCSIVAGVIGTSAAGLAVSTLGLSPRKASGPSRLAPELERSPAHPAPGPAS